MPARARDYVHRIGRTGRAGDAGESHSLVLPAGARPTQGLCSMTVPWGGETVLKGGEIAKIRMIFENAYARFICSFLKD